MIDSNFLKIGKIKSLNVSRETLKELEIYSDSILLKNKEINLISRNSEKVIKTRHIEDSAQIIECIIHKYLNHFNRMQGMKHNSYKSHKLQII